MTLEIKGYILLGAVAYVFTLGGIAGICIKEYYDGLKARRLLKKQETGA